MTDSWLLYLPFRRPPLAGNSRWAHPVQERRVQGDVQKAAWALARNKRIPALQAVIVELVWYPGRNGKYDSDNIAPTLKPLLDGLVKAKVLPDDNSERVLRASTRVVIRRNDPYDSGTPRMVLHIQDASVLAPLAHYAPEEVAS